MKGNQGKRSNYTRDYILIANRVQCEALRHSDKYRSFYKEIQKGWTNAKKRKILERKAWTSFGISLTLLQLQGYNAFFSDNEEWPPDVILFPEYMEFLQFPYKDEKGETVYNTTHLFPGLFDEVKIITNSRTTTFEEFKRDHEIIAIPKNPLNKEKILKVLKAIVGELQPTQLPNNVFHSVFKIGKNRVIREGTMRRPPKKMLEYFKWLDYYINSNKDKSPLAHNREGYGRVAEKFNIERTTKDRGKKRYSPNSTARAGIKRALDAIDNAGKGYLLYPILEGRRRPDEPDWHEALAEAEKHAKEKPTLTSEQKKKIKEHKKKLAAFDKRRKEKRVINKKVYPSIEEEEKQLEAFLNSQHFPFLREAKGMKYLKIKS